MRANPFENQLERLARTLTEQFGVKVICQGDQAFTDGKQIMLPSLPEPMGADLERMVVGYLDHEMSHVAFSDFKVVGEFSAKHPGCEGMLNVVEDALVERRAMRRWPGVRANLDAMFRQIRDRVTAILSQSKPFHRFCTAVYFKLSHHRDMMGLEQEVAGYDDLLDQFPAVRNTREAAALADKILNRWMKQQPKPNNSRPEPDPSTLHTDGDQEAPTGAAERSEHQSSSTQKPDSNQRPDEGDPQSDDSSSGQGFSADETSDETKSQPDAKRGESPGSEDSEENGASGDSQSDANQGPGVGDGTEPTDDGRSPENDGGDDTQRSAESAPSQASAEQQPASEHEPHQMDSADTPPDDSSPGQVAAHGRGGTLIGEALAEAIAECVAHADTSTEYRVFTKEYDRIYVVPSVDEREVRMLLRTGADTVRRLRRGLANALRSAEKRWWREDQTRGALSPRTLHRLCIDQPRLDVFRRRSMVQGRSTAVCIVLDASGSMTSHKMSVARDSMRVLLEALDDLKIATEAFTFTTGQACDLNQAAQACGQEPVQVRERFSRISNLEIGVIKHFGETAKVSMRRLAGIRGIGLTPLGEAMHVGAGRLIVRLETRKIMLVLTDGKAGCEGQSQVAHLHAQDIARKITRTGIELAGVGIKDDSLCEIVEDTIVVHELADLPAQLCKLLGRTLKRGLRHVG